MVTFPLLDLSGGRQRLFDSQFQAALTPQLICISTGMQPATGTMESYFHNLKVNWQHTLKQP